MSPTPVPASLSPSATAALAALDAAPGGTVNQIAAAAGIGASTAANALKALERLDLAHRTIGGYEDNRRLPDHWFRGPSEGQAASEPEPEPALTKHEEGAQSGQPQPELEAEATARLVAEGGAADPDCVLPQSAEDGPNDAARGQHTEPHPATPDAAAFGPTVPPGAVCPTCGHRRPVAPVRTAGGGGRLGQGQLHQLVLDHLRAHPDQEWTATGVAKVISRSSGAIANALAAMVTRGEAEMTNSAPRRFRALAPAQQAAAGA